MTCALPDIQKLGFDALLILAKRDDKNALALLTEQNLGLVYACIKRFYQSGRDMQELYQQGCMGLIKAIKRFDTSHGVRFSTYAVPLILGEIRQFLRDDSIVHIQRRDREKIQRIEKAQALLRESLDREPTITELANVLRMDAAELIQFIEQGTHTVSIDRPIQTESGTVALIDSVSDPRSESFIDRIILHDMLQRLPKLERWLIYLRFELGHTQMETAKLMHMSQVQVSRLEQKLRVKLMRQWHQS